MLLLLAIQSTVSKAYRNLQVFTFEISVNEEKKQWAYFEKFYFGAPDCTLPFLTQKLGIQTNHTPVLATTIR